MKPIENEMALFLNSISAPQSRRIVEVLIQDSLEITSLSRKSRLSIKSIELHLAPLLEAKIVKRSKRDKKLIYILDTKKFSRNTKWFSSINSKISTKF